MTVDRDPTQAIRFTAIGLFATISVFALACGGNERGGVSSGNPTPVSSTASASLSSPTLTVAPPPPLRDISYRVEPGDTVSTIAEDFGVSTDSILEANQLSDPTSIVVEQILNIPGVDPALAGAAPLGDPTSESPIGFYLAMPITGACLPRDDTQMPNSPREYRNGIHEGADFFTGFACIDVPNGLPALATADGKVIRSDQEYKELTQRQLDDMLAVTQEQGYTDPGTLDRYRGRQVWIDHGGGIVTRYAHLSDIPLEIQVGTRVTKGQVVAFVGDSGSPEALEAPGYNNHLHFEVRIERGFLGEGLPPNEVRLLYESVFGLR